MEEIVTGSVGTLESSRIERILAAAGASGMLVGAAAIWYFDPSRAGFFPVCPLFSLTGFACPGCGMTRGLHAFLHGDIASALGFNALLPLFLVLFGFGFLTLVSYAARGKRLPFSLFRANALWPLFILLVVFGVVRNLPFYPFTFLYP